MISQFKGKYLQRLFDNKHMKSAMAAKYFIEITKSVELFMTIQQ